MPAMHMMEMLLDGFLLGDTDGILQHDIVQHWLEIFRRLLAAMHSSLTAINVVCHVQIAKLLIVPFVCLVERFWLQRHFTRPVIASILVVVAGVGIV